jgi:Fe2+ transport system protein FeoA
VPLTASANDAVFAATAGASLSLDRLAVGGQGRIVAVTGETRLRRRLLEMGLSPGVMVTCVRRAPLGDPIEFQVRGYHLSLRANQAALVAVHGGG